MTYILIGKIIGAILIAYQAVLQKGVYLTEVVKVLLILKDGYCPLCLLIKNNPLHQPLGIGELGCAVNTALVNQKGVMPSFSAISLSLSSC